MFIAILLIIISGYFLNRLGEYLDLKSLTGKLPLRLQGIYDSERYQKMQDYENETTRFSFISDTVSFVFTLLFLIAGGFGILDQFCRSITDNEVLLALLFFGILGICSEIISLPFSLYSTFVIEEKYGFNKTTPILYLTDKIKGLALGVVLGGTLLVAFIWFFQTFGELAWLIAWFFLSVVTLIFSMFYASWIVPLFNKLTPLETGELRSAIEKFCSQAGFSLNNVFVIDGSKRSTRANAYFSGFGPKKMIVLYDTLIAKHSTEELLAILAHEVGHYKKKHIIQSMLLSFLQSGFMLWTLNFLMNNLELSVALGSLTPSIHLTLVGFGILFSPLSLLMGIGLNLLSRKNEFEADAFAAQSIGSKALKSALTTLSVENLSNLQPHPFNVFISYSHPTLLQRLQALDTYDQA